MQALETNYFIEMRDVEDTVSKNVFLSLAAVREPGTCKYSKHIGRVWFLVLSEQRNLLVIAPLLL